MNGRLIVDAAALARLVDAAADRPHPELRAALVDLVNNGTAQAPLPRATVSPQEYAELHGLSVTTVYRRLADGTLPAEKFGQLWRIPTANGRQQSPTVATPADSDVPAQQGGTNNEEPTT